MFKLLKVSVDIVWDGNAVQLQYTVKYEGFYI